MRAALVIVLGTACGGAERASRESTATVPARAPGLAPPRVAWSGMRVLFSIGGSDGSLHATPLACTDGVTWLPVGACVERIAPAAGVRFADGSTGVLGAPVIDETYGRLVLPLAGAPDDARSAAYATPGAPADLRTVECVIEDGDRDESAVPPRPLAPLASGALEALPEGCASLRSALAADALRLVATIRGDFDGDGETERIARLEAPADLGLLGSAVTLLERAGASRVIEIHHDVPFDDEPCAPSRGPLFVEASECFDFDADGAVELLGRYRGDGEREVVLVELDAGGTPHHVAGVGFGD